jgi:hypothetical protein
MRMDLAYCLRYSHTFKGVFPDAVPVSFFRFHCGRHLIHAPPDIYFLLELPDSNSSASALAQTPEKKGLTALLSIEENQQSFGSVVGDF